VSLGERAEPCFARPPIKDKQGNTIRYDAPCGHDRASHHREAKGGVVLYFDCLCRGCGCKGYVSEEAASAWKKTAKAVAAAE
jgi:hypothetical protein